MHIKMKGPLYLSPSNSEKVISVPARIVENLKAYQIDGVRFLYQQCILKKQNVVLNNEYGMNEARQLSALLTALNRNKVMPTLIICLKANFHTWHYEFSQANLNIITANELVTEDFVDDEIKTPDAVLISHDELRHIKALPIEEWLFVVVENIELIINSRYIKNINAQYKICLTSHNFLINNKPELQYNIIKWTNPLAVEANLESFLAREKLEKESFLRPFPEFWRHITWLIFETEKPTTLENENYEEILNTWKEKHFKKIIKQEKATTKITRPRKREPKKNENKKQTLAKQRRLEENHPENNKKKNNKSRSATPENYLESIRINTNRFMEANYSEETEILNLDNSQENELLGSILLDEQINENTDSTKNNESIIQEDEIVENNYENYYENTINKLLFENNETKKLNNQNEPNTKIDFNSDSEIEQNSKDLINSYNKIEIKKSNFCTSGNKPTNLITDSQENFYNKTQQSSITQNNDYNFILDSLLDNTQTINNTKNEHKTVFKTENKEESCPILDLLF